MRTTRCKTVLLLAAMAATLSAASLETEEKLVLRDEKIWDKSEKDNRPTSIEAYVEGNVIRIEYWGDGEGPLCFQIKNSQGLLVYQDITNLTEGSTYYIDISTLPSGRYRFIYFDYHVELVGDFMKE